MSSLAPDTNDLLGSLLRDVSRSFYLTLRVLPAPVRRQIGIAYLLARATDTVADTEVVELEQRLALLGQLRRRILGNYCERLELRRIAQHQGTEGERALMRRIEEALHLLEVLPQADCELIREVLKTITSGQELDLERFAHAAPTNIVPLANDAELEDYTYRVAGCVGEFWTKMCLSHLDAPAAIDREKLTADGILFGRGLQLVNILRDLSADLAKGRCYIPQIALARLGLQPGDLTKPEAITKFRPLYDGYLQRAEDFLAAGWRYTNTLPYGWVRVRLACAWPILIGVRTIALLRRENPLDATRRIKVSRAEVKKLMALSAFTYPAPFLWRGLYQRALRP